MASEVKLDQAVRQLTSFFGTDPLDAIRRLETSIPALTDHEASLQHYLDSVRFSPATLTAALEIKSLVGQVNVLVHASGIIASLPHILEPGEQVMSLSLGAGNASEFDLITNRRIAEFKFIAWRGGSESIRQNQVFQDCLKLLWDRSGKRKQLYLTGTQEALRFLTGGRALDSVLSKNVRVKQEFLQRYGSRFDRVGEFYSTKMNQIEIIDLRSIVPVLAVAKVPDEAPAAEEI
jgi:hypothetical protein